MTAYATVLKSVMLNEILKMIYFQLFWHFVKCENFYFRLLKLPVKKTKQKKTHLLYITTSIFIHAMRNIDIFIFVFWVFHIDVGIVCLVREVHWCLWFLHFSTRGVALPLWCYCYCQRVIQIGLFPPSFIAVNTHSMIYNSYMRLNSMHIYNIWFLKSLLFFAILVSSCTWYLCLCACSSYNPEQRDSLFCQPFSVTFHLLL